jgi:hypothetical protein
VLHLLDHLVITEVFFLDELLHLHCLQRFALTALKQMLFKLFLILTIEHLLSFLESLLLSFLVVVQVVVRAHHLLTFPLAVLAEEGGLHRYLGSLFVIVVHVLHELVQGTIGSISNFFIFTFFHDEAVEV